MPQLTRDAVAQSIELIFDTIVEAVAQGYLVRLGSGIGQLWAYDRVFLKSNLLVPEEGEIIKQVVAFRSSEKIRERLNDDTTYTDILGDVEPFDAFSSDDSQSMSEEYEGD